MTVGDRCLTWRCRPGAAAAVQLAKGRAGWGGPRHSSHLATAAQLGVVRTSVSWPSIEDFPRGSSGSSSRSSSSFRSETGHRHAWDGAAGGLLCRPGGMQPPWHRRAVHSTTTHAFSIVRSRFWGLCIARLVCAKGACGVVVMAPHVTAVGVGWHVGAVHNLHTRYATSGRVHSCMCVRQPVGETVLASK